MPIDYEHDMRQSEAHVTLEAFVAEDDRLLYGYSKPAASQETQSSQSSSLYSLQPLVHLNIFNDFDTIDQFHDHLDGLNLLDQDRLRPAWDTYFMVWRRFQTLSQFLLTCYLTATCLTCIFEVQLHETSSRSNLSPQQSHRCNWVRLIGCASQS
jgi:hypothetical protein